MHATAWASPGLANRIQHNCNTAGSKWCTANEDIGAFGLVVKAGKLSGYTTAVPPCLVHDDVGTLEGHVSHLVHLPLARQLLTGAGQQFDNDTNPVCVARAEFDVYHIDHHAATASGATSDYFRATGCRCDAATFALQAAVPNTTFAACKFRCSLDADCEELHFTLLDGALGAAAPGDGVRGTCELFAAAAAASCKTCCEQGAGVCATHTPPLPEGHVSRRRLYSKLGDLGLECEHRSFRQHGVFVSAAIQYTRVSECMALTVQECAGLEETGDDLRDYCGVSEGGLLCAPGWQAATSGNGTTACERAQSSTPTSTPTTTGAVGTTARFSSCADVTTPTSSATSTATRTGTTSGTTTATTSTTPTRTATTSATTTATSTLTLTASSTGTRSASTSASTSATSSNTATESSTATTSATSTDTSTGTSSSSTTQTQTGTTSVTGTLTTTATTTQTSTATMSSTGTATSTRTASATTTQTNTATTTQTASAASTPTSTPTDTDTTSATTSMSVTRTTSGTTSATATATRSGTPTATTTPTSTMPTDAASPTRTHTATPITTPTTTPTTTPITTLTTSASATAPAAASATATAGTTAHPGGTVPAGGWGPGNGANGTRANSTAGNTTTGEALHATAVPASLPLPATSATAAAPSATAAAPSTAAAAAPSTAAAAPSPTTTQAAATSKALHTTKILFAEANASAVFATAASEREFAAAVHVLLVKVGIPDSDIVYINLFRLGTNEGSDTPTTTDTTDATDANADAATAGGVARRERARRGSGSGRGVGADVGLGTAKSKTKVRSWSDDNKLVVVYQGKSYTGKLEEDASTKGGDGDNGPLVGLLVGVSLTLLLAMAVVQGVAQNREAKRAKAEHDSLTDAHFHPIHRAAFAGDLAKVCELLNIPTSAPLPPLVFDDVLGNVTVTPREHFNVSTMGVSSISSARLHARPMWALRTCR